MDKNKIIYVLVGIIAVLIASIIALLVINNKDSKTYTVLFETNGGSLVETQTVKKGETVSKPTNPEKEGYVFEEWTYLGKTYDFNKKVESDLKLIAKWNKIADEVETFTVKFDSDGGTTISSLTVKKGDKIERPDDPKKEGYSFDGWFLNDEIYDFEKSVNKNIELKAKWVKTEKKQYVVTFNSAGGNRIGSQMIEEGEKATKPVNPTRNGYKFECWLLNGKEYNFDTAITRNITLLAKWTEVVKKQYIVTFNSNGGSTVASQTVEEGSKVTKPANPTRNGYKFECWLLNGKEYNFDTEITRNITLLAKWTKVELKQYTVTFNSNGGSTVASQTVEEGSKVTKPANPTRDGYKFECWLLNGKEYNFNSAITGNITLTAKWTEVVKKQYIVTFNSNGGSTVASQTVEEGSKVTKPANPTRNGYKFECWLLNGTEYNFNSAITGNITLTAKWTEVVKKQYTVTFNSNGGSTVASQTVEEGNKVTKPANPTRDGYKFECWLLNGTEYNFNSAITGNITLTAKWVQKTYTIKVEAVDPFSPDVTLSVYEEGNKITFKSIKYSDGVYLCSGTNPSVEKSEIANETTLIVVLNDGTEVKATIN